MAYDLGGVDADAVERELAEISAHLDAATHRQLTLIRILDACGHWHRQGAKSCAHWLSWRIGLDLGAARERVRVARALGELPAIDDALRRGELSYSKARAMSRVASAANEAKLLEMARSSTAAQLEKICRGLRKAQRDEGITDEAERSVRLRHRDDGTVRFEATLLPDEAARVMEAVRAVLAKMGSEQEQAPTLADAVVRLADAALADASSEASTRTTGADRAQVLVHLAPDALEEGYAASLDDGTRVSAETFRRIACDCALVAAQVLPDGMLDVGRKTRSIPPALRRAVMLRDRCCAFPGCTHDRFIDIHHVEHWAHGGETKLGNLLALCTFHHQLVHEGGWRVELADAPRFIAPHGRHVPAVHATAPAPDDPLEALRSSHAELEIDDETGLSAWDGSAIDYEACVQAALPREDDELDLPVAAWLAKHSSLVAA